MAKQYIRQQQRPPDPALPSRVVTLLRREGGYRSAAARAFTGLAHELAHARGYTPA